MNTTIEGFHEAMHKVAAGIPELIKEASKNISPWVSLIPRKTATTEESEWALTTITSPKVCCSDASVDEVEAAVRNLRNSITYSLQRWGRSEYSRLCKHKIFVGEVTGSEVQMSHLDEKFMAWTYKSLESSSAVIGACDTFNGKPRFLLLVGRHLDGTARTFDGFKTEIENFPTRWSLVDGQWVEEMPYTLSGSPVSLSQSYLKALFEEAHVFSPTVMEIHVPSDEPESYFGGIRWVCEKNEDPSDPEYNPDAAWGFFRAELKLTAKPVFPEHGVVIRHLR